MICLNCNSENMGINSATTYPDSFVYKCSDCGRYSKLTVYPELDTSSLKSEKELEEGLQRIADITANSSAVKDNINSPSHYTQGKYETIDVVRDVLGPEKFEGHCVGNILKYVFRYPYKNGIEDLKKAEKYLEWLIETKEEQKESASHDKT